MTTEEFQTLKPGDKVRYMNTIMVVLMVETETDFSNFNMYTGKGEIKEYVWKVHYNTGTNNEITDNIVKYLRKL